MILQRLVPIVGLLTFALGIWIWISHPALVIPWHIRLGFLLVLLLLTVAILAARAGAPIGLVALAVVFTVLLPIIGLTQARLLVGPLHWIVQVIHLAVAILAIGLTQRTAQLAVTRR